MQRKSRRKWPWVILTIIIVLVAAFLILSNGMRNRLAQVRYSKYTASLGSVEASITGSGKLASSDTKNIDLPDGIELDDVLAKSGDVVSVGQTLATLDVDSLRDQAAALSEELASLDRQLTQMNKNKVAEFVYTPVKGRIKYLPVAAGDDVIGSIAAYGALAILSTDERMQIEVQTDEVLELYAEVAVKWDDDEKEGEVTSKTATGYRITLPDNGTPYGETATVYDGRTLIGSGVISINKPVAVYASGGKIGKIHYKENATVAANVKLFTLEDEPLSDGYQQTFSQRRKLAEQLQTITAYINNPSVAATHKGTISEVLVSDGSTISSTSGTASAGSTSTAFVVNLNDALKMTIDVDELDIRSVVLGQGAQVTLDAVPGETFAAAVTRISFLGNAQGSITTYAVELTLQDDQRFLEGMNGNATILVNKVDNVLIIPIEVINEDETGVYVYVSPGALADGSDRRRVDIKTGLSDGEYAEVTGGLSQGEVVLYVASSSGSFMFPGMPGGMSAPSGMGGFGGRGDGSGN